MGKIADFVKEQFKAYGEGSIELSQMLINFAKYGRKLGYWWLVDMLEAEIKRQS